MVTSARKARGKVIIVNSSADYCARHYADQDIRWGQAGDYALALQAMQDNGLEVHEIVCDALDHVTEPADLFFLRDWRYPQDALSAFINRFPDAKTVMDLRINPFEVHSLQRRGELWYLCNVEKRQVWQEDAACRHPSDTLKLVTTAFIGSSLNQALLEELGKNADNMRTRFHVTPWRWRSGQIAALQAGRSQVAYDRFRVLFVGKCIFRKGLLRLYAALRSLALKDWELVAIAGNISGNQVFDADGNNLAKTDLMRDMLTHPNVRLLPFNQSVAEMIAIYQQSHVHVCPSLADNGPNTVIESMVCGLPVLISDMAGALESVPGPYRVVFKVPKWWKDEDIAGCEQGMAEAILSYYRDIFLKKQVVEHGEALRRDYLKSNCLFKLYAEYKDVFAV
jgi:glycosyltransferase involved in cell wall biosynthesis